MDSANAATMKNGKGKSKAPSSSKSEKVGLQFPVGRVKRYIKEGNYVDRIGAGARVSCCRSDLLIQVLEFAGEKAKQEKNNRITPSHIKFAVKVDKELRDLCCGAMIQSAGAPPTFMVICCQRNPFPMYSIRNLAFSVVEESSTTYRIDNAISSYQFPKLIPN